MKPLIYVADGQIRDLRKKRFDVYIRMVEQVERQTGQGTIWPDGVYLTPREFEAYVRDEKPTGVHLAFDTQEEFDYLIDHLCPMVQALYICAKHNRAFDLSTLERCEQLESIELYWNTKQEALWDVKKNKKLKHFELKDYYHVSDFSAFRGSSIEDLRLFGCNSYSSFASKMHVDDLSFILDMPNLQHLWLDVIKDESSAYYLNMFAKCERLLTLNMPHGFFTFQQFAWLKAKLPHVNYGLEGVTRLTNFYTVIGKRMPGVLEDEAKAQKYQKRYDALVVKYRSREVPPADDEKD